MKDGLYVGPAGQFVLVVWDDGPYYDTGCTFYTLDGTSYCELDKVIQELINGYEYLGEI
jgi:hypothetical protein